MFHRHLLVLGLAGVAFAVAPTAAASEAGAAVKRFVRESLQVAPVVDLPALPDGSFAEVDGTSVLIRTRSGVGFTLDTTDLAPDAPYTAWWVAFNRPRECTTPYRCGSVDLDNPDAKVGVFFASGRVSDGSGQANFAAQIDYGELPEGEEQVPNPARANPIDPGAEIHIILRSHGPALADPEALEAQLTQFNGGCPPNSCANEQASIHRAPVFRYW